MDALIDIGVVYKSIRTWCTLSSILIVIGCFWTALKTS